MHTRGLPGRFPAVLAGRPLAETSAMPSSFMPPRHDIPSTSLALVPKQRAIAAWRPLAVLVAALAYAGAGCFVRFGSITEGGLTASIPHVIVLFAAGLAPVLGAAVVVWTSRGSLSPTKRRSQLTGAAMGAVLFFPALLLLRWFG